MDRMGQGLMQLHQHKEFMIYTILMVILLLRVVYLELRPKYSKEKVS